jgi:heptosyltransferase I
MSTLRILVIRLSSMGDVIHTLPSVALLKKNLPNAEISWLIRPRWTALLEGNPSVAHVIPLERSLGATLRCTGLLRSQCFDLAVDFQGLIQSASVAKLSGARQLFGFAKHNVREKPAAHFYASTVESHAAHVVDQNIELAAAAAGIGQAAPLAKREFPMPPGKLEGSLPDRPFVIASPFAGWGSKQWPLEYWSDLAARLPLPLVVNGPPSSQEQLAAIQGATVHLSGIPGLIDATRRATAFLGLDSGPLHIAAALGKPGIALFGPTDPARNGPYGGTIRVLRDANAITNYHRSEAPDPSMRALTPEIVGQAMKDVLERNAA